MEGMELGGLHAISSREMILWKAFTMGPELDWHALDRWQNPRREAFQRDKAAAGDQTTAPQINCGTSAVTALGEVSGFREHPATTRESAVWWQDQRVLFMSASR